jgi:hypothetical protein
MLSHAALYTFASMFGVFSCSLRAQTQIPVGNAPPQAQNLRDRLEVEQIQIGRQTATPSAIRRNPGKFLLMLSDPMNFAGSFAVVRAPSSEQEAPTPPLLTIDRRFPVVRRKQAAVIDLPPGEYQLKSVANGQVYCTITLAAGN